MSSKGRRIFFMLLEQEIIIIKTKKKSSKILETSRDDQILSYSIVLEPASGTFLEADVKVKNIFQDDFFRLGILFDNIYVIFTGSKYHIMKYNKKQPFANILETNILDNRGQRDIKRFNLGLINNETIKDYKKVYREYQEGDDLSGGYGIILLRGTIYRAFQYHWYIFVLPRFRESFLKFVLKYQPKYIDTAKESFLIQDLLELIFQTSIPSFDPLQVDERMSVFTPFKKDFQKGFFDIIIELKGSYFLSQENKDFVKEKINSEEKKLLIFLDPENLKRKNFKSSTKKFLSGLILDQFPILELGKEILDYYNDIKKVKEFEAENLNFILSLFILKKYFVAVKGKESIKCDVCNILYEQIEGLSIKECEEIIFSRNRCEEHLIAYLDIRKMYSLFGKNLLLAMKDFERFASETKNEDR